MGGWGPGSPCDAALGPACIFLAGGALPAPRGGSHHGMAQLALSSWNPSPTTALSHGTSPLNSRVISVHILYFSRWPSCSGLPGGPWVCSSGLWFRWKPGTLAGGWGIWSSRHTSWAESLLWALPNQCSGWGILVGQEGQ